MPEEDIDEDRREFILGWALGGVAVSSATYYGAYRAAKRLGMGEEDLRDIYEFLDSPQPDSGKSPTPTEPDEYTPGTEIPESETPDEDEPTPTEEPPEITEPDQNTTTETPVGESEPYIESVELYDLPASWSPGQDMEIGAVAEGNGLERLEIRSRKEGSIGYEIIAGEDLENKERFELTVEDYEFNHEVRVDYWARAVAGGEEKNSQKQAVEFRD